MKVRSLLALSAALAAAVTVALAATVWRSSATSAQAEAGQGQALEAARDISSLLVATQEFARSRSNQAVDVWRARHQDLTRQLRQSAGDAAVAAEWLATAERLRQEFERLAAATSDAGPQLDAWMADTHGLAQRIFQAAREKRQASNESARNFRQTTLMAVAALAALLIAQGLLVAAKLLRPLGHLEAMTDAIARGDLRRAMVERRDDEIGQLARRFDAMVEALAARDDALRLEMTQREQSERRIRAIADHIPGLVAYVGNDQRYRFTNARFGITGKDPSFFIGRSMHEMLGDGLYAELRPHIEAALRGEPVQFERRTHDDQYHRAEYIPNVLPDGSIDGFHSLVLDVTSRRRAEAALRESQASLAITGRLAGVGGWWLDLDASVMHWTENIREIHEVAEDYNPTLVDALDFIEPEAQGELIGSLEDGVRTGKRWQIEVPLRSAKGQRRWVNIVGDTEYDADGQPVRVIGALQDVTARKVLEMRLQTQEAFIRDITDHLPIRIGYLDRGGRYQFVNQAHCRRYGLPREQVLGRTRAELIGEGQTGPYRMAAMAGQPQRFEFEEVIDGQVRHMEAQLIPDVDEHGQVRGLFTTGVDITERKSAERALRQLTDIFDNTPDFIVQTDTRGQVTYMNPAVRRAIGLAADEDVTGRVYSEFYDAATSQRLVDEVTPFARQHGVWLGEGMAVLLGGRLTPVSNMVIAHREDGGRVSRFSSVMRNISDEVHARDLIHRQTQTLASVAEAMPAVIAAIGPDETFRFVNSSFEHWHGRARADILARPIRDILGSAEYAASAPCIRRVLDGETVSFEREVVHDSRARHQRVTYVPLRLPDGRLDGFVSVALDVTAQKQEELRLLRLSERDALTGVLNRQGFEAFLAQHHSLHEQGLALLYIDLDRFKPVNDTYGHPMGDALLKAFAERLRSLVRPTDVVARLGGDEFAVILPGIKAAANAEAVADKIVAAAASPFPIGQLELRIGASVGVALAANDGWDGLVQRADAAVYRAKAAGRGQRA